VNIKVIDMQSKMPTTKEQVNMSIDVYFGRKDDRGVRTFRTHLMPRTARAFVILCVMAAGLFNVGIGIRSLIWFLSLKHHYGDFWQSIIISSMSITLGSCMTAAGIYMLGLYTRIARTSPVDKVCSKLGIREEHLETIAEERDIKPQYNVDGLDYYNMADFKDVGSLLRASQQPTAATETLLRPAANAETSPETLLRADTIVPPVSSAGSEEQTTELKVGINKN
jgi:hypothetical protein